jgi:hypothetical protein
VKRLLQVVSGMLAVLACALLWRIVQVLRVAPPVFVEPSQVASGDALPPAPRNSSPRGAAMDAIVEGNLFESERGQSTAAGGGGEGGGEPLPPPTNVVLNGIFVMEGQPMAIVSDSTAGNKQLTLRVGDSVGDYQVGDISDRRVTLLGRGGQQFSLDLDIKKGPQAAAPVTPARAQAATTRVQPAAATGQTAAQRAAAARAAAAAPASAQSRARPAGGRTDEAAESNAGPDPSQARMDALRRLREASQQ